MTKLVEIPFDASLIGQEGIIVKYRNGETPDFVKAYKEYITTVDDIGDWGKHNLNGRTYGISTDTDWDLLMYRESKVMSVEEWLGTQRKQCIGAYWSGFDGGANMLAAAIKNGEVEL